MLRAKDFVKLACGGMAFLSTANGSAQSVGYILPESIVSAQEARQGVASDGRNIYVIDNSRIGNYAIGDSRKIGEFVGDPATFPHLNSCTLAENALVCASSNYPAVPHRGTVEIFDPESMTHLRSIALPANPGSLTALDRHDGRWWAVFANYDGKGGIAGQDHTATVLTEMDGNFAILRRWTFPETVLRRIAPYSISGASWSADGRLFVSGHDKPEVYVLALPEEGTVLRHAATWATASFGQAIDFDPADPGRLWSIDRKSRVVIASRVPPETVAQRSSAKGKE